MATVSDPAMVNSDPSIPAEGTPDRQRLVEHLASQVLRVAGKTRDLERQSWVCIHTHIHGVAPLEYDVRHVPEALYLQVLAKARQQQTG